MAQTFIKLSDGIFMPQLGLGTLKANNSAVYRAVKDAIDIGYRHFDCAYAHQNEEYIGKALNEKMKEGAVCREHLFITSKLWNNSHERCNVVPALRKSLDALGLEYVDLYLMHWPLAFLDTGDMFPLGKNGDYLTYDHDFTETWQGLEECVNQKLTKLIGVSNFNCDQIDTILGMATIKPINNQIESHPYLTQCPLIEHCMNKCISVTAYAPLGKAGTEKRTPNLLIDSELVKIAKIYNKTTAQLLIRYQLQRGLAVVPKTIQKHRLQSNFDVFNFQICAIDMKAIDELNKNFRFAPFSKAAHAKDYPFHDSE